MGPQRHQPHISAIAVLVEKDERIKNLETQIQAFMARTSHVQTRLFSTLDALDTMRSSHTRELASETRAKEKLRDKLDLYIDFVNEVKSERDDLKDAVTQLIQKVELSNDLGLWPHSRIRITSLADPITRAEDPRQIVDKSDQQLLTYASAMIMSLRAERDSERRAHKFALQHAESRISELEAQLAHREAQLEFCVAHTEVCFNLKKPPVSSGQPSSDYRPMLQEEMVQALDTAHATNKALEIEINGLVDRVRLEMARARQQLPSHENLTPVCLADPEDAPPLLQLPPAAIPGGPPPQPALTPRQSLPRALSPHIPDLRLIIDDPTENADPNSNPESQNHHWEAIPDLRRQIAELATQIDAFKAERDALSGILVRERREHFPKDSPDSKSDLCDRLLLMEEECGRLRKSEQSLQQALEASTLREDVLREEIERLDRAITIRDSKKQLLASRGTNEAAEIPHLIDEYAGEMSMDLATPLHPTSLLPVERNESQDIDPPSIPLPQSPVDWLTHSLIDASPPPPESSSPALREPGALEEANLKRVENELDVERRRLEGEEHVLSELRGIVKDLQWKIVNGEEGGSGL